MSSNSVCNHTRGKQTGLPLRGRPILLSLVRLLTELDSTQSYYHYLLFNYLVLSLFISASGMSFSSWWSSCGHHCLLCLLNGLYGIKVCLFLVHFIQIVLPLLLYESEFHKTNVHEFFFYQLYQLNFQQFQANL